MVTGTYHDEKDIKLRDDLTEFDVVDVLLVLELLV